jgi:EmrB/QacA subfamily drug resistance transporter
MAVASDEGLALHSSAGRTALVATVAASAMASLDATVVNVALPHIGKEFHASVSSLQWVLTGYLLALASLILLGGALGDRFGRRKVFLIGTAWFAVASLLCGIAPNIGTLIAARFLEGVGGALLTPGSLAIIQASFRQSDRAAAVGAWSGLGGVAGAIGPFVGGVLVDGPGWRWAFLINLPVAALAMACAVAAVPETRDPHAGRAIDVRGAALAALALAAGTWALTEAGPRGWTDPLVVAGLIVAAATAAGFVRHILRTPDPLVPPGLFRNRTFTVVNLGTVLLYAAIGLTFFLVAYVLEVAAHWSALRAGIALLPTTVLMLLFSSRSAALGERIGPRLQLTVGPLVTAAGLLMLTRLGPHTSWLSDVFPASIILGLGLVTFVAPLTATVMGAADPAHVSVASGVNNAVARTASLTALAVVPVVSGLTTAVGPAAVAHAVRIALVIAAVLAASAGAFMGVALAPRARAVRTARRSHCAVDGPPLQPDPARCPVPDSARAA